jgi:beta-D-xylosidase 4
MVILNGHHYTKNPQHTVSVALHAETDLNYGGFYSHYAQEALHKRTIVEADIDQAVIRNFHVLVHLGYFDPSVSQPYRQIPKSVVDTNASRQFALE